MKANQVLKELKSMGTAQNRKVYARHGMTGDVYGVSYADLGKLRKKIKVDHELALELWASGNHDARVLATMVADPERMKSAQLEAWKRELDNYAITDAFVGLVVRTPFATKKMEAWTRAKAEYPGQAGWNLVTGLAMRDDDTPDAVFDAYLKRIEKEIHGARNRVKHAMNMALCAIGMRNAKLEKRAVAVARRIGKVEVDHGETGCKTPDAESYIQRGRQRRRARA